ncbi:hypothetical protein GCM10017771_14820 [Streptomyces capitiformicae]|uniref:DUF371 domain-containing protein n=1 Tax=Streptomyces capitiformicae TaxID=2014920 RepID=A0A919L4K4_9ACTN|nr:DUF371 domain-containing protein [Streptomyces capitiformicae]GHH84745.1 hypothetical protein GCM10017771_14820 [Streptomyces capitiformicae]
MKIHARGHGNVRAIHAKTLEITSEPDITPRATCVIGVGAAFDDGELTLLRGPVAVRLSAGGHTVTGSAVVNPQHSVTDRLVLRRSDHATSDTFAVRSTVVASTLDRDLVAAMSDPASRLTLTLTETGPRQPLILVGYRDQPEPSGRLGHLWRNADASVALDTGRIPDEAGAALDQGGMVKVVTSASLERIPSAASAWLAAAAGRGARFEVVNDATGTTAVLLAAGLPAAPVIQLGQVDRRMLSSSPFAALLRSAPVPAVFRAPAADLDVLAGLLGSSSDERRIAVPSGPPDVGHGVTWISLSQAVRSSGRDSLAEEVFVLAPQRLAAWHVDLRPLLPLLVEQGVTARTLSTVLRPFGISRRDVYDALSESPGRGDAEAGSATT